jgi:hypothetical protein
MHGVQAVNRKPGAKMVGLHYINIMAGRGPLLCLMRYYTALAFDGRPGTYGMQGLKAGRV